MFSAPLPLWERSDRIGDAIRVRGYSLTIGRDPSPQPSPTRGEGARCRCRDLVPMLQSSEVSSGIVQGGNWMTQHARVRNARSGYVPFLFASLLALTATVAASFAARADELLTAKVGVLPLSSSAPVFIAQEKGYFREAGLEI